MAAASSEDSPTTPATPLNSSLVMERNDNRSRSPSLSSVNSFQWTSLLISKPSSKKGRLKKGKGT